MSDAELAEARRATIAGDAERLKAIGTKAVSRLELMPKSNPEAFKTILETLPLDDRKRVRLNSNGHWTVNLGKQIGTVSWGVAVRQGYIKI